MRAIILSIGDEILNGQTLNSNAQWLGQELSRRSVQITRSISLPDSLDAIKDEMRNAIASQDWVFVTGGLGPTIDDITKKAICDYYKVGVKQDIVVLHHIETLFASRGLPILESNTQQSFIPANATVLFNEKGTAPGILVKDGACRLVFMPGVPAEMRYIMRQHILPSIEAESKDQIENRHYRVIGVPESVLANRLKPVEEYIQDRCNAQVAIAYLPNPGQLKIRITSHGNVSKHLEDIDSMLVPLLGQDLLCKSEADLADWLQAFLIKNGETLAVAESCTGGRISAELVAKSGASGYFKGGVVAYSNEIKENILGVSATSLSQYGAVSEQVVLEMASGVAKKFKANYAISISGIAGPDGGTEEKPVGTVWVGLYLNGKVCARKFQFFKNRKLNLELSNVAALDYLRRNLELA